MDGWPLPLMIMAFILTGRAIFEDSRQKPQVSVATGVRLGQRFYARTLLWVFVQTNISRYLHESALSNTRCTACLDSWLYYNHNTTRSKTYLSCRPTIREMQETMIHWIMPVLTFVISCLNARKQALACCRFQNPVP